MDNNINYRLMLLRKAVDLNQEEFAEVLGISKNYISLIENNKRTPSERTINDVCRLYGANKEYLLLGEGRMFSQSKKNRVLASFTNALSTSTENSNIMRLASFAMMLKDEQLELLADIAEVMSKK